MLLNATPKEIIATTALRPMQYAIILICFLMNMLDGMDVLVISYTAPAISREWATSPETLGIVFGAGMAGMTLGTFLIAPLADRFGRKTIIIFSGLLMGCTIYLTAYAQDITQLMLFRFLSGLGIGSMLASTTSLTAEYSPEKSRDFWISFVLSGYPAGAILSGVVAAAVVPEEGWRYMYRLAGIATLMTAPLVILLLSESIEFYLSVRPRNALTKVNRILGRMNIARLKELPDSDKLSSKIPVGKLFKTEYRKTTLMLWAALFMVFSVVYYLINWIPKLASDAGMSMELAIYAGTTFNAGAFIGMLFQGYLSSVFGLKRTIGFILIITGGLMASFGLLIGTDWLLLLIGLLGFGIQGGLVGLYSLSARVYPAGFRTTGIGWAMGAGRLGGIAAPMVGGLLIGLGMGLTASFMLFAIPAFLAGLFTFGISTARVR